ncbi:P-loop containing nucleoside triphosphate hydrolase protein [Fomitiporia mediterranea MF3/22]|uniref:P-loop containing nucleoside triphosphate hydrolase protein n=1 Tax=Fomitiporia mediterranea (strain MF3/22) TaxID=694068 RepID=UPI0004408E14|nr:P-loop containing nucleoside triphosphate hydrolase protein [Fomitiporia mediterranea MF3/22]EJD03803.1 P-loop containing nucleoside triphosphate hydrolase protein [Fomitiporia mediterranea MF3/22]
MLSLSMLEIFLLLLHLAINWSRETHLFNGISLLVAWIYATTKIWWRPPTTPPYLIFLFYIMNFVCSSINTVTILKTGNYQLETFILSSVDIIVSLSLVYIVGTFPVKEFLPGPSVATAHGTPSSAETMPEDNVTLWQWCTFSFAEPIFHIAQKGRLEVADVWSLSPFFKHKNLFLKYLEYRNRHPTHSLLRFLIASNSLDLILDIVLELWSAVAVFGCVYSLQRILSALEATPKALSEAYFFAFVTFVLHLSFAQVDLFQAWHSRRSYERARGQLFCAIHYKALKIRDHTSTARTSKEESITSVNSADLGKIVNLMQGDAYNLSLRFWQASTVFAATVRLILSLVFLYRVIGVSAFAGVVVVLVAYALNWPLAKANIHITRQSWKARDVRMSGVNELFQNVRFLKLYGWTGTWTDRVLDKRERELRWRVKENICAVLISFVWIWVPSAMALFSFLFYTVVAGGRLTVSKTFTSLALFSFLRGPMLELPDQLFSYLHAYVSYQRINGFLKEEEVSDWTSTLKHIPVPWDKEPEMIGFKEALFEWYGVSEELDTRERFRLGPLNINFPLEKLTLVTGSTASGKSALLNALLGELSLLGGEVSIKKSDHFLAYCAQNPWLEHATIRDNVIFKSNRGYDEQRYNAVVEACALLQDLSMFEAGDLTEIGEKGVTLSGGQRARVALARALYSDAKCILLDDPLAAVDMHTARHIVEQCLRGDLMKGRTVILVTHHISICLPVASYIVELSGGKVIRQGTVTELQDSGQLKTVLDTEDDTTSDKDEYSDETIVEQENEADEVDAAACDKSQKSLIKGKLVEAEYRAEGRVSLVTYMSYVRAAGWISWTLTLSLMILIRLIQVVNDLFLANWSEAFENMPSERIRLRIQNAFDIFVTAKPPYPLDRLPSPNDDTKPWLFVYLVISVASAIVTLAYISLGYYASLQASRKLFTGMLTRLSRAPARFFDVTPLGRILNRFSTDINAVDGVLQQSARSAITGVLEFLASFLFIVGIIPKFAPFAVFVAWLYIRIAPPYIRAARDLRRLESVSISPAFSGFDELLRGITHVRAFGMEHKYQESFYKKVDLFQGFDHVYWLVAGWLRWRYDCLGSVVVFLTTIFALWSGASDGFTAIVIVQAGVFAEASRQLVRVLAQLELDFNSVERIGEYLEAPQEAPAIVHEKRPPAYWPSSSGKLVVEDLVVRYAPDLPTVLNNLSFTVNPGEKIGVVGRTGSGKTTLALTLLRVVEPSSGRILLDGIDIGSIGLEDLRTKITTVSQDVSLFTGSIRSNLDPFGEHSDLDCIDALERCHINKRDADGRDVAFLDTMIGPTGSLSAGERQLIALARAILRRSQVIIMDEATSQIDTNLDDKIQRTIREELSGAMVITIAHRLKTIIDYDRVLVLGEGGRILEFDTPRNLFKKPDSAFREMCKRSADWDELKSIVEGSESA